MKIAVLSDVHGNYIAFKECLKDAKKQKVDRYIFLGDYLGEFPYPQNTLDLLYDLKENENCVFLRGNKEDYWLNCKNNTNCDWKNGNHSIAAMIYNYENLKEEDLAFFERLPISETLMAEGFPEILFCHGSPDKNNVKLLPDDDQTKQVLCNVNESIIVCGHTHIEREFSVGNKRVINAGAVGVPLVKGGHKTQYLILETEDNGWKKNFRAIEYDINPVINDIHESGLYEMTPFWCRITIQLLKTGKISHGLVLSEAMKVNNYKDPWYAIPDKDWEKALQNMGVE